MPRKWYNLTNRKVTMTITGLTIYMEDMAENIDVGMINAEEDIEEEETKEEPIRRNTIYVSVRVVLIKEVG
jgi:hypothetical protein